MAKREHTAEEIINILREAGVVISSGSTLAETLRRIGVSEQTFYRWRAEYGGLRVDQARCRMQLETENSRLKRAVAELTLDNQILRQAAGGTSDPPSCRLCIEHVRSVLEVSERRARKVLRQSCSTHRHEPLVRDDEQALTNNIVGVSTRFGQYGYRRITALLRRSGWVVNHKRVERSGGGQGISEQTFCRCL